MILLRMSTWNGDASAVRRFEVGTLRGVPSRWVITFAGDRPERVRPWHLHAVVCGWLERPDADADHRAPRKTFSVSPPAAAPEPGLWQVDVGLLDDALVPRLLDGLEAARGAKVRLGSEGHVLVPAPDGLPASCSILEPWERIVAAGRPWRSFTFSFETPVTFRSGDIDQPLPLAGSVFGHLRSCWQAFGPASGLPPVDFKVAALAVTDLDGRTVHTPGRYRPVVGFRGTVTYRMHAAEPVLATGLHRLAQLADVSGVGSGTTTGSGVTRLVAVGDQVRVRGRAVA